jgi:hypothetical protein
MNIKGELFNQDMTVAFLENRKGRTSRPIQLDYDFKHGDGLDRPPYEQNGKFYFDIQTKVDESRQYEIKPKYQSGDIMYGRETFRIIGWNGREDEYDYKADGCDPEIDKGILSWHPSLHMPRKASRLWFRVTDVKVQNIKDMTVQDAVDDGFKADCGLSASCKFNNFWTGQYGLDCPWMWVYSIERISKKEALKYEQ